MNFVTELFLFLIFEAFKVNSNEIRKAVSVRDVDKDKAIFEVLNLAMSQKGYLET